MYNREFTPDHISSLKPNEIFVFGSNLEGSHGGGAAEIAHRKFGAVWGQGIGLQGQSYAIPTMVPMAELEKYVNSFIEFVFNHPELKFYVPALDVLMPDTLLMKLRHFFLRLLTNQMSYFQRHL